MTTFVFPLCLQVLCELYDVKIIMFKVQTWMYGWMDGWVGGQMSFLIPLTNSTNTKRPITIIIPVVCESVNGLAATLLPRSDSLLDPVEGEEDVTFISLHS